MPNTPEYQRKYYSRNKKKMREYYRSYYLKDEVKKKRSKRGKEWRKIHVLQLAAWRLNSKHKTNILPHQLFGILKKQKRLCALTGRRLTAENFSVDHIIPIKNGGKGYLDNIRFVVNDANRARGTLTDAELLSLCKDIMTHSTGTILQH